MTTIRKQLTGAHCEVRKGTAKEANDYCNLPAGHYPTEEHPDKSGEVITQGLSWGTMTKTNPGKRSDLLEIQKAIRAGTPQVEIADRWFGQWVRYHKAFDKYAQMQQPKRSEKTQVLALWAPTGTGKSTWVRDMLQKDGITDAWWANNKGEWFDGYHGQSTVVFDEYEGQVDYRTFLRLMDGFPLEVPIKGGFTNWAPSRMIVLSSVHPSDWYKQQGLNKQELFRRINIYMEGSRSEGKGLAWVQKDNISGYKINTGIATDEEGQPKYPTTIEDLEGNITTESQ